MFSHLQSKSKTRCSSREVRIRAPFFSVVYFSRGTESPPKKKRERRALGDLEVLKQRNPFHALEVWAASVATVATHVFVLCVLFFWGGTPLRLVYRQIKGAPLFWAVLWVMTPVFKGHGDSRYPFFFYSIWIPQLPSSYAVDRSSAPRKSRCDRKTARR